MAIVLPPPPGLASHAWRPLRREDAPALHHLELECAPIDGSTSLSSVEDYLTRFDRAAQSVETDTLGAVNSAGHLAAAAWVTCDDSLQHERRAFLDGRVHHAYRGRGLGSFVLRWMEARALQMLSELDGNRPGMLRIDFHDRSDDALDLFEQHGFRLAFAEDEMRWNLTHPVPEAHLPAGMILATWSSQTAGLFFETYRDAFRERPRFPNWSEEVWRQAFASGASFRVDLSLLLLEDKEAVGFVLCHVEDDAEVPGGLGWIAQMGVRPVWRNRGLGAFVLCEVLRRLEAEGLAGAALEVNVDNDRALRLYQRLGFERHRRRTSYQKVAHTE